MKRRLGLLLATGLFGIFLGQAWGQTSLVFDPNPVNKLNNTGLTDKSDADSAVPEAAYTAVTLTRLDPPSGGLYHLTGSFVSMESIAAPANTPPTSATIGFSYHRNADAFEEVMCYYQVTRNQEYIQSLGFLNVNNRRHRIDAHGFDGEDNSQYVGSPTGAGYMEFGDGGVDDAEDADIILHEYGHSIQDNSTSGKYFGTNNRGYGDETGAMGEGFGDYWACSCTYNQSIANGYNPAYVGDWDQNPYMRTVNGTKTYPSGMVNQVHADGEIWSACLWEIFLAAGKTVTDAIVLKSHFLVPDSPSFEDGANAILAADNDLYGGSHAVQIRSIFVARGILNGSSGSGDVWDPADNSGSGATEIVPIVQVSTHGQHQLSASDPADWYKAYFTYGVTYTIAATAGTGDTYGSLYDDAAGTQLLASDDDSGGNLMFRLVYIAGRNGWHYLKVRPYSAGATATYQLSHNGGGMWSLATNLGSGWRWTDWFGYFALPSGSDWIYHNEHGWMYCLGTCTDYAIWFWTQDMGWLWSNHTTYPYFYRPGDGAWLWYQPGSDNPRWFYNYSAGVWEAR